MIKCVGCYELLKEVLHLSERAEMVVYNCPKYFPYATTIGGLIRPGKGIIEAVKDCPQRIEDHCLLCGKPPVKSYYQQIVFVCTQHDRAWSKWLDKHPERFAHLAPKGRSRQDNWIEVYREFIEDMRRKIEGSP